MIIINETEGHPSGKSSSGDAAGRGIAAAFEVLLIGGLLIIEGLLINASFIYSFKRKKRLLFRCLSIGAI
jgi:hypothetical protein